MPVREGPSGLQVPWQESVVVGGRGFAAEEACAVQAAGVGPLQW